MVESALNKRMVSQQAKGSLSGEVIQVPQSSSCVSGSGIATEAGAHISEPTCHEFIRAEKGVGWQQGKHRYVLNTS